MFLSSEQGHMRGWPSSQVHGSEGPSVPPAATEAKEPEALRDPALTIAQSRPESNASLCPACKGNMPPACWPFSVKGGAGCLTGFQVNCVCRPPRRPSNSTSWHVCTSRGQGSFSTGQGRMTMLRATCCIVGSWSGHGTRRYRSRDACRVKTLKVLETFRVYDIRRLYGAGEGV